MEELRELIEVGRAGIVDIYEKLDEVMIPDLANTVTTYLTPHPEHAMVLLELNILFRETKKMGHEVYTAVSRGSWDIERGMAYQACNRKWLSEHVDSEFGAERFSKYLEAKYECLHKKTTPEQFIDLFAPIYMAMVRHAEMKGKRIRPNGNGGVIIYG